MKFSTHCEQKLDHFCESQARIILFGHWILSILIFLLDSKLNDGTIGFTVIRVLIHFGTVHGTKSFMQDLCWLKIELRLYFKKAIFSYFTFLFKDMFKRVAVLTELGMIR